MRSTAGRVTYNRSDEVPNKLALLLVTHRNCFTYSEKLGAYIRGRWVKEDELVEFEIYSPRGVYGLLGGRYRGGGRQSEYLIFESSTTADEAVSLLKFPEGHPIMNRAHVFNMAGELIR